MSEEKDLWELVRQEIYDSNTENILQEEIIEEEYIDESIKVETKKGRSE